MIPREHGFVYRYPQQHSDEMVGGQQRIIDAQELAVGKALKTGCQCSEHTLEALLVPTAANVGKPLRIGNDQPP